jgi:hypothetical protein
LKQIEGRKMMMDFWRNDYRESQQFNGFRPYPKARIGKKQGMKLPLVLLNFVETSKSVRNFTHIYERWELMGFSARE